MFTLEDALAVWQTCTFHCFHRSILALRAERRRAALRRRCQKLSGIFQSLLERRDGTRRYKGVPSVSSKPIRPFNAPTGPAIGQSVTTRGCLIPRTPIPCVHPRLSLPSARPGRVLTTSHRRPLVGFQYRTMGMLASLGGRSGIADVFGSHLSGLPAWLAWRSIYWAELPGVARKIRVIMRRFPKGARKRTLN